MLKRLTNYHTHSNYSDGRDSIEDLVLKAIELNFDILGISDHCPLPFESSWAMKLEQLNSFFNDVDRLREVYSNRLTILKGMEIDYIPGVVDDKNFYFDHSQFDYTIGSVHILGVNSREDYWSVDDSYKNVRKGVEKDFDGDSIEMVKTYYKHLTEMIMKCTPDIVGHLDLVKIRNGENLLFNPKESWYLDIVENLLQEIKKRDVIVEINTGAVTRKFMDQFYPSDEILRRVKDLEIPIMVNSDAHRTDHLNGVFGKAYGLINSLGFKEVTLIGKGGKRFSRRI